MKSFPQEFSEFGSEKATGPTCQAYKFTKNDSFVFIHTYKYVYLVISVALQRQSQVECHNFLINSLRISFLRNMKKTRTMRQLGKWTLHIPSPINYSIILPIPFSISPWTCNCIPFCLVPFWSCWHLLPPLISKAMSSKLYALHKEMISLIASKIVSHQFQWPPQIFVFKENNSSAVTLTISPWFYKP